MKNIRRGLLFLCFTLSGMFAYSQQQGQYSQYMMNYFLINPAVAGTEDYIDVRAGYRMQWTGLSGAPRNYYVSATMPLNKVHNKMSRGKFSNPHHSIGAIVSGQTLGILTHNTAYLSYAYHLPLSSKAMLSMGAVGGINQFTADPNKADWGDNVYDPSITGVKKINFDLGVGVWFYTKKIFMGLSSMQIPQSKIDFSNQINTHGILDRHFYLTGGYKFKINEDLMFIPSLLFKGTAQAYQVDVNGKLRYRNRFWAGASYRRTDAVAVLGGLSIPLTHVRPNQKSGNNMMLEIGYSYDLTTSRLNQFSYGTHEIMVALLIPTKGRMLCPSDFW
jgi:type IX secretion system PorP/SprF family membrane protein